MSERIEKPFVIEDWAGNLMDFGSFKTWDDAEEFLCARLGDDYETDRQEYFICDKSEEKQ